MEKLIKKKQQKTINIFMLGHGLICGGAYITYKNCSEKIAIKLQLRPEDIFKCNTAKQAKAVMDPGRA